MEENKRKEETRNKFYDFVEEANRSKFDIFEFFWSEIEARDAEINALNEDVRGYRNGHEVNSKRYAEALSKLSQLEAIIEQADDVIQASRSIKLYTTHGLVTKDYNEALEKYESLKSGLK